MARTSHAIERLRDERVMNARSAPADALQWYWNRLRCMSVPELGYRLSQRIAGQIQQFGIGTAEQVPVPRWEQFPPSWLPEPPQIDRGAYVKAADTILAGRLRVFDIETTWVDVPDWNRDPKTGRPAPLRFGKKLNYRDETQVGDIKYLWEPNRHLHLVTLAQAYRLTGAARYAAGLRVLLESWLAQCPYLRGPNWTSSLELAIRLINWSLVWALVDGRDSGLFAGGEGDRFRRAWLESAFRHMHFIAGHFSRFSSANNHLIGEAAGLYLAAITWPFWPQADRWRARARAILEREALGQNAPDGVNREQAIAYQQFVLDFLLLSGIGARAVGDDFPEVYWRRIARMLEYIAALMDVGGRLPMIGDADDGFVTALSAEPGFCPYRSLLATGAVLFHRSDFKHKAHVFDDKSRWLLGEEGERTFDRLPALAGETRRAFPDGGYWVLGKNLGAPDEIRIVVDAGPLGHERIAAHGHADALAFTLSVAGREILIDPGTYAYHTHRAWRDYFRGTAAHNTVRIDREDQSVMGGPFMWLQHARACCTAWQPGEKRDVFVGTHDGYARLPDPVIHERELVLDKTGEHIRVVDTLRCGGEHTVERCWHFAEDVEVRGGPDGELVADAGDIRVRMRPGEPVECERYHGSESPRFGWVSRRFGVKAPMTTAIWRSGIRGATRITALLTIERRGMRP